MPPHRFEEAPTMDVNAPIALDGLAFGIDHLDAIVVFYIGDARVHASWVRADAGFTPPGVATALRDAYRACHGTLRAIDPAVEQADPLVTLETAGRVILLSRVKSSIVGALFDAQMPLGMARLMARRIATAVSPELPDMSSGEEPVIPIAPRPITAPPPLAGDGPSALKNPDERGTRTLSFPGFGRTGGSVPPPPAGAGGSSTSTIRWSPSRPPPPRMTLTEEGHARRLLTYLESRAPEPHVARLRVALRAGLTPVALDHPEALGADAMVLLETAVEEILGVDRAELRSLP
jgi:hypothetical protein